MKTDASTQLRSRDSLTAGILAVMTWLVWQFGVAGYVFRPGLAVTLLGISASVNVALAYLLAKK